MPDPILIVDDDSDIRESLRDALSDEGFTTAEAADGGDALAYLRDNDARVSLVLLDWNMAPIDGPTFMAEARRDPTLSKVPVVLLTADARFSEKAASGPFVASLKKPVSLHDLLDLAHRFGRDSDS